MIPKSYSIVFLNYELATGRVNSRLSRHAFSRSKKRAQNYVKRGKFEDKKNTM